MGIFLLENGFREMKHFLSHGWNRKVSNYAPRRQIFGCHILLKIFFKPFFPTVSPPAQNTLQQPQTREEMGQNTAQRGIIKK